MPTVTKTITLSSSSSRSIITMAQTHNQTDTSLTAPFNLTATTQVAAFDATSSARSIITMAKTHDQTDTSLTSSFNTTFNLIVTQILAASVSNTIAIPDVRPIIFHTRTDATKPVVFHSRADATLPVVFYSHGPFLLLNKTDTSLTADLNHSKKSEAPVISSSVTESIVSMNQTNNKTDTSLTADFSLAIA